MASPPPRFQLDTRMQRQLAWARLWAGLVALVAGVWLLFLPAGWVRLFGAASLVFGALWLRSTLASLRAPSVEGWLELGADGIECVEGNERRRVAWRELDEIVIDHDRLELQLHRRDAPPMVIEPRYCQLGLDELARRVEAAWSEARAASPGSPGARPTNTD